MCALECGIVVCVKRVIILAEFSKYTCCNISHMLQHACKSERGRGCWHIQDDVGFERYDLQHVWWLLAWWDRHRLV
jgi:hypothetical protein